MRVGPAAGHEPLVRTLRQLREDPAALVPPAVVVPRLAWLERVTLMAAREKLGGKSTLATAGAAAVTRGGDFLGEPCAAGDVLWITADQEHASDIVQRAERFGADVDRLHVWWPRGEVMTDLLAIVSRVGPRLVTLDSLANWALVEDPHSSAEWPHVLLPLVQLARDFKLAVLILHHAVKSQNGGYRDDAAGVATVLETARALLAAGRPRNDIVLVLTDGEEACLCGSKAFVQQHPRCSKLDVRTNVGGRSEDVDVALAHLVAQQAVRDTGNGRRHAYEAAGSTPPAIAEEPDELPF